MERFAKLHKSKPAKFYDLNKKREDASDQLHRLRKDKRTGNFNLRRNIPGADVKQKGNDKENIDDKSLQRKIALTRYQNQRNLERNKEKQNKKPPFVVGIPHHGSSPLLKSTLTAETDIFYRTLRPEEVAFNPPRVLSVKKLTTPHTPTVLKRSGQKTKEALKHSHQIRCHLHLTSGKKSKQNIILNPKKASNDSDELLATQLPSVENGAEERNSANLGISEGVNEYSDVTDEVLEPLNEAQCGTICHSTGGLNKYKQESFVEHDFVNNARGSRRDYEDIPDSFGTEFQIRRLEQETARLTGLAREWEAISRRSADMPQDTVDEVDCVVGQTRLLINNKFKQFRKLVDEYDSKKEGQMKTCEDLNGFWDMMYLQVSNLTKRYDELDKLRNNKWVKQGQSMKKKRGRPFKLKLETEPTSSTKAKGTEAETISPSTAVFTPSRKSLRLLGKTPTPIKPAYCVACVRSPLNTSHTYYVTNDTKSKRTVTPSQKVTAQLSSESSYVIDLNPENKTAKCKTNLALHLNERAKKDVTEEFEGGVAKTPLRRSERKRTCVLEKSKDGNAGTDAGRCLKSDRILRAANKQSGRSVIFTSNVVEKTSMKRPATPFVKRGAGSPESLEDSWSSSTNC